MATWPPIRSDGAVKTGRRARHHRVGLAARQTIAQHSRHSAGVHLVQCDDRNSDDELLRTAVYRRTVRWIVGESASVDPAGASSCLGICPWCLHLALATSPLSFVSSGGQRLALPNKARCP